MSVMTMSYAEALILPMPSLAEAAVSTAKPLSSRIAFNVSRIASSSSTSRMRLIAGSRGGERVAVLMQRENYDATAAELVASLRSDIRATEACDANRYNTRVPSYFVENFGCRATQADGAAIERQLLESGFQRAFQPIGADVVVLNTCTVT